MGEREYALPSGVTPFKDAKMQALKRVRWLGLVVGSVLGVVVIHGALADVTPHVYPYVGYSGPHYVGPSGHAVCNTCGYDWSHSENLSFYGYYTQDVVEVTQISQSNAWEDSAQSFVWGATWLVDGYDSNNTESYIEPLGTDFTTGVVFYPAKNLNYDNPSYNPYVLAQWGLYSGGCNKSSIVVIHGPN